MDQRSAWLLFVAALFLLGACRLSSGDANALTILSSVAQRSVSLILVSFGLSLVISAGDIDLSVGGLMSFLGMLMVACGGFGCSFHFALVLVLLLAAGVGLLQGWLTCRWQLSALVLTLGTSFLFFGLAAALFVALQRAGRPISLPQSYAVPFATGVAQSFFPALALIGLMIWRFRSLSALRHLAIGLDRKAAALAGLNSDTARIRAFVLSGLFAGGATVCLLGYQGGWTGRSGLGYELLAIAAAVVGGARITGGFLHPLNVLLAAILLRLVERLVLVAPLVTAEVQGAVMGAIVVAIALLDGRRGRSFGENGG